MALWLICSEYCSVTKREKGLLYLTTTLLILLVVRPTFSAPTPQKEEKGFIYKAERVSIAPVVDGYLDDPAWKKAKPEKLQWNFSKKQPWNQLVDFDGLFASVWHSDSLYIAVKLEDNYLIPNKKKDVLKQDHLEIHLDFNKVGKESDQSQYLIATGNQQVKQKSPLETLAAWGNNYKSFEFRLSLPSKPSVGDEIHFGIFYHDFDGNDKFHQTVGWSETSTDRLAKLAFTKTITVDANQKAVQWGRIKSLY